MIRMMRIEAGEISLYSAAVSCREVSSAHGIGALQSTSCLLAPLKVRDATFRFASTVRRHSSSDVSVTAMLGPAVSALFTRISISDLDLKNSSTSAL